MQRRRLPKMHVTVFVCVILLSSPKLCASLVVSEWLLETGVFSPSSNEGVGFFVVENPFQSSHSISLPSGLTTSTTSYDFVWSEPEGIGTFLIDGIHQAEDSTGVFLESWSEGRIFFTPSVDLIFSFEGQYTYDLPVSLMAADLLLSVAQVEPFEFIAADSDSASTLSGGSDAGTLSVQGQGILSAGTEYRFRYRMDLQTFGTSGALATGSGDVSFHLEPVPEPSTLSMLALASLLTLRRRAGVGAR